MTQVFGAIPYGAMVIPLLLVPVFYSISVLDLKLVKWEPVKH